MNPIQCLADGHLGDLNDVKVGNGDGQGCRLKSLPVTHRAGRFGHEAFHIASDVVGSRVPIAALESRDGPLVSGIIGPVTSVLIPVVHGDDVPFAAAIEDDVELFGRQLEDGDIHRYAVVLGGGLDQLVHVMLSPALAMPGAQCVLVEGQIAVRDDEVWIELALCPQSGTSRTGSMRAVEREGARFDVRQ